LLSRDGGIFPTLATKVVESHVTQKILDTAKIKSAKSIKFGDKEDGLDAKFSQMACVSITVLK